MILLSDWCRTRMRPARLVSNAFLYTTNVVSHIHASLREARFHLCVTLGTGMCCEKGS